MPNNPHVPIKDPGQEGGPFGLGSMSPDNDPVFQEVGLCHRCANRTSVWNCRAFPQGIPREILRGDVMHTKPYPNDNHIQFVRAT